GILIADRCIGTDQNQKYVVVVQPDGLTKYQTVETGPIEEGLRVIRTGLSGDETVIVEGIGKVRPNIKVKAEPTEMTKYATEELAIETHINAGSPDVVSGASGNRAKSGNAESTNAANDKDRLSAERSKQPESNGKNE
ncbi:MAG TPA: hypothetical protein VF020_16345, partial [Chthoniobacterales bacterium]